MLLASLLRATTLMVGSTAVVASAGLLLPDNEEIRTPRAMAERRHQARDRIAELSSDDTRCMAAPSRKRGRWVDFSWLVERLPLPLPPPPPLPLAPLVPASRQLAPPSP